MGAAPVAVYGGGRWRGRWEGGEGVGVMDNGGGGGSVGVMLAARDDAATMVCHHGCRNGM